MTILIKKDLKKIKIFLKKKKYFKKFNIKIIENKKNFGAGESRNIAIRQSNSKYIAFLDSDDIWSKNKLKFKSTIWKKIIFYFPTHLTI
jgi:teichuronic acid biosynthesis glycosyltransferase TuaG